MQNKKSGFTLLEILLVVAAIAILAGIVILAINPTKQIGDTKNAQRRVDANTILNAVYQYSIDNKGNLPGPDTITTSFQEICKTGTANCSGYIDLDDLTTNEKYITAFPVSGACATETCYRIKKTANDRITVECSNPDQSATISVTR